MSKKHAVIALAALSSLSAYSAEYQLTDTRARAILVADVLTAKCPTIPGFEGLITDYRIAVLNCFQSLVSIPICITRDTVKSLMGLMGKANLNFMRIALNSYQESQI